MKVKIKIRQPISRFFQSAGRVCRKIFTRRSLKLPKAFKIAMIVFVVLIALTQIVFAILLYGFKMDNREIRLAAMLLPYPAAVVNQDIVSYKEYFLEKDYIHHFYETTKQDSVDFSEVDKQILDQLIENKLVSLVLTLKKQKIGQSEVDLAMAKIIEQNGGEEKVEKVLADYYGLNLTGFRQLIKNQLARDKINENLIEKVSVRHILIRVDKEAAEDKSIEAKTKIEGILNEIKAGLDFAEAAKKYSEDVGSNEEGGKLEPFARGEMVAPFSDSAFALSVGEISAPVQTEFGWHIIKVESKNGTIKKNYSQWLADIESKSLILKLVR